MRWRTVPSRCWGFGVFLFVLRHSYKVKEQNYSAAHISSVYTQKSKSNSQVWFHILARSSQLTGIKSGFPAEGDQQEQKGREAQWSSFNSLEIATMACSFLCFFFPLFNYYIPSHPPQQAQGPMEHVMPLHPLPCSCLTEDKTSPTQRDPRVAHSLFLRLERFSFLSGLFKGSIKRTKLTDFFLLAMPQKLNREEEIKKTRAEGGVNWWAGGIRLLWIYTEQIRDLCAIWTVR